MPLTSAHRRKGFTLIEMLVTLSVAAILAVLAVPGFRNMIAQSEIRAAATTLAVAMARARSEATKRSASVQIIPNDDDDWSQGWWIPDPTDVALAYDPTDANESSYTPRPLGAQTKLNGVTFSSAPDSVVFLSTGRVQGSPSDYRFTIKSKKISSIERCVSVDVSGAPNIKTAAC